MPETAACSMDIEDVEGKISKKEEFEKDEAKLFLTESASVRLTQVLKLESEMSLRVKEKTDMSLCARLKQTNCVVDQLSQMETESEEPEKMPELYYYM